MNARSWARTALAAVVVFLILLAALHFIEPEFDPSKRLISEYELSRYGWVMSLAFFSLGIGVLAMLRSTGDAAAPRRGRIGRWWFVAIGIALFGAGTFYPYPTPEPRLLSARLLRCDCDRHVPDCGNALQCCLGEQPGVDHLTGRTPMGNSVRLAGITLVCGIDSRCGNHLAACGAIQSPFNHWLAESIHDRNV